MIIAIYDDCHQVLLNLGPLPGQVVHLAVLPRLIEVSQQLVSNVGFLGDVLSRGA